MDSKNLTKWLITILISVFAFSANTTFESINDNIKELGVNIKEVTKHLQRLELQMTSKTTPKEVHEIAKEVVESDLLRHERDKH